MVDLGETLGGIASGAPTMLGGAFGSVMGMIGQGQTNAANQNIADQTNANSDNQQIMADQFNAAQTTQQEAYQSQSIKDQEAYATDMSNTSYQRGVADLTKAGLNPLTAQMSGGASTPQGSTSAGASASAVQAPQVQPKYESPLSSLKDLGSSLMSMMQSSASIKNTQAQTNLANAQTLKTAADSEVSGAQLNRLQSDQPEHDMIGKIFSGMQPYLDKLGQGIQSTYKALTPDPNPDAQQQIDNAQETIHNTPSTPLGTDWSR